MPFLLYTVFFLTMGAFFYQMLAEKALSGNAWRWWLSWIGIIFSGVIPGCMAYFTFAPQALPTDWVARKERHARIHALERLAHLKDNPEVWKTLALALFQEERFSEAAEALNNAGATISLPESEQR